jgi:hypothetical protein
MITHISITCLTLIATAVLIGCGDPVDLRAQSDRSIKQVEASLPKGCKIYTPGTVIAYDTHYRTAIPTVVVVCDKVITTTSTVTSGKTSVSSSTISIVEEETDAELAVRKVEIDNAILRKAAISKLSKDELTALGIKSTKQ